MPLTPDDIAALRNGHPLVLTELPPWGDRFAGAAVGVVLYAHAGPSGGPVIAIVGGAHPAHHRVFCRTTPTYARGDIIHSVNAAHLDPLP